MLLKMFQLLSEQRISGGAFSSSWHYSSFSSFMSTLKHYPRETNFYYLGYILYPSVDLLIVCLSHRAGIFTVLRLDPWAALLSHEVYGKPGTWYLLVLNQLQHLIFFILYLL